MKPVIVSIANYKGGVGKTTLTAVLASSLAVRFGKRVLLIDADPQSNLTEIFLSYEQQVKAVEEAKSSNKALSYDYIMQPDAEPFVHKIADNLAIIPSKPEYMRNLPNIFIPYDSARNFRERLITKFYNYDYIFIDLPPQMYGLVASLVKIADALITPVSNTAFAVEAVGYLLEHVKGEYPPDMPRFLGAVLIRFRSTASARIKEFREKVEGIVKGVYSRLSLEWELDGLSPVFNTVLYESRILADIRAIPLRRGSPRLLKLVSLRPPEDIESLPLSKRHLYIIVKAIDLLTKEFEERVQKILG